MTAKKVVIALPTYGFDPTEAAIPWKLLSEEDIAITFATPDGAPAAPDGLMMTGEKLGIWKSVLRARRDAVEACHAMQACDPFLHPISYSDAREQDFDALHLPGGHDKRIKEYLESEVLQRFVVDFFTAGKPVGAICHGVVVAARSINPDTGKSILHEYKTTSLLRTQELLAHNMTRMWMGDYYLTYPGLTVEDEVRGVLADGSNFVRGPAPRSRDSRDHPERGFFVRDRNYLSSRWPGDVYAYSFEFARMVREFEPGRALAT